VDIQHHLVGLRRLARHVDIDRYLQLRIWRRVLQRLWRVRALEGEVLDILAEHVELGAGIRRGAFRGRRVWSSLFAGGLAVPSGHAVAVALARLFRAFSLLGHEAWSGLEEGPAG